jgi:hypothetical protein
MSALFVVIVGIGILGTVAFCTALILGKHEKKSTAAL